MYTKIGQEVAKHYSRFTPLPILKIPSYDKDEQ